MLFFTFKHSINIAVPWFTNSIVATILVARKTRWETSETSPNGHWTIEFTDHWIQVSSNAICDQNCGKNQIHEPRYHNTITQFLTVTFYTLSISRSTYQWSLIGLQTLPTHFTLWLSSSCTLLHKCALCSLLKAHLHLS